MRARSTAMLRSLTVVAVVIGGLLLASCRETPAITTPAVDGAREVTSRVDAPATTTGPSVPDADAGFVPERVEGEGRAMGTHLAFAAYTTPARGRQAVDGLFAQAVDEIRRIEALMTTWRPDSEISRINAAAGKDAVAVSDETFAILKESVHAGEISSGAFDVTFQTLHGLWKFDEDLDPHPPDPRAIAERLAFVGYRNILLDPAAKTVKLAKARTQIGLGGIAKGYAVDRASDVLSRAGLTSFYVQAGGDLYARGRKPDGSAWQAGVRDPRGPQGSFFAKVSLEDHAFSTAGDYERSYVVGGKRYHHILDPRTGQPANACRSVTIWAETALLADEIDDAVFVLGPAKGLELVEATPGVGAVVVDAKNNLWVSKRMQGKVELVRAPTDGL